MKKTNSIIAAIFVAALSLNALNAHAGPPVSLISIAKNAASHANMSLASVEQTILAEIRQTGMQATSLAALESSLSPQAKIALIEKLAALKSSSVALTEFNTAARAELKIRNELGNADGSATSASLNASSEVKAAISDNDLLLAFEQNPISKDPKTMEFIGQTANDSLVTKNAGVPTITNETCKAVSEGGGLTYNSAKNLNEINHAAAEAVQKAKASVLATTAPANAKSLKTIERIRGCSQQLASYAIFLKAKDVLFAARDASIQEVGALVGKVQAACRFGTPSLLVPALQQNSWSQMKQNLESGTCAI